MRRFGPLASVFIGDSRMNLPKSLQKIDLVGEVVAMIENVARAFLTDRQAGIRKDY